MKNYLIYSMVLIAIFHHLTVSSQVAINKDGSNPNPSAILDVKGSSGSHFYIDDATGKVGVGTISPNYMLDVQGDISVQGSILQNNNGNSVFIGVGAGINDDLSNNQNVFIGYSSGNYNITGQRNSAVGASSLVFNTAGSYNTAFGHNTLRNSTGSRNTAIGYYALYSNTASYSVAMGEMSLKSNTSGEYNTAIGSSSLRTNITTSGNTAIGYNTLYSNVANSNTATGKESLRYNTSGYENTSNGFQSLYNNTNGYWNTAMGTKSLYNNSNGDGNIAIGYKSLYLSNGNSNTAIGTNSAEKNSNGYENASIGFYSLYKNIGGYRNTALGTRAFYDGTNYYNSTAIGYFSYISGSNQVRIGNSSVSSIGGHANWTNVSDGRFKTNINENIVGLDFILKLRPVTYNLSVDAISKFNNTPTDSLDQKNMQQKESELQCGFIAQEVEQAAQEVNFDFHGIDKPQNNNDYYGLRYAEFVVPLVKSIQEQQEIIIEQKQQLLQLQNALEKQQIEIEKLKNYLNIE